MANVRAYTTRSGKRVRSYKRGSNAMRHVQLRRRLSSRIAGLPEGGSAYYNARGRAGVVSVRHVGDLGQLAPKGTRYVVDGPKWNNSLGFTKTAKHAARLAYRRKHKR